jgi:hypothetical protein
MRTEKDPVSTDNYRKKPVVIQAIQWTGDNWPDVVRWLVSKGQEWWSRAIDKDTKSIRIPTLEGVTVASAGDWIIRGVAGEFYACKPEIFAKTYEKA